jgi:hypothetical protein
MSAIARPSAFDRLLWITAFLPFHLKLFLIQVSFVSFFLALSGFHSA